MSRRKKSINLSTLFRNSSSANGRKRRPLDVEQLEGRELFAADLTPVDFNGDNISDIAFHRPGSTWGSVPALIAQGNGQWTASNQATPSWANQPGVNALPGDYNGDGKTDIAFHRPGSHWNTIPILFSQGNGRWVSTNYAAPNWGSQLGAKAVTGDFNNDGKTDIAFHRPGSKWATVPVLFARGNGSWYATNNEVPGWANQPGVKALAGDFDRDGQTDIAFQRPGVNWGTIPVLFARGNGTWYPTTHAAPGWANHGEALPGDYNNDGLTDIAFHNPGSTWSSVPVLFARGNGTWTATNFAAYGWANQPGVEARTGDFNGDGRTDIAFHRPGGHWNTVPVMLSRGNGTFASTNYAAPSWANTAGAQVIVGDFNRDGRTDLAFHRPGGIWNTVPVLFARGNGSWSSTNYAAPTWAHQPGANAVNDTTADRLRLYVNFDGVTLTASEMDVYANSLDPENDGVRVSPLLASRGDRESIISSIISRVQADLDPFGLVVERHWGDTVENVGATTIYVGKSNFKGFHEASSIDIGNDNPTDIAFVSEESWGGNVSHIVSAMSDVILHEAGHTYGLYHVNVVQNGVIFNETMGLRYSTGKSQWTRDTGFLNRAFSEYLNHGEGLGPQNSYQTLMANTKNATSSAANLTNLSYAVLKELPHHRPSVDALFAENDHQHLYPDAGDEAADTPNADDDNRIEVESNLGRKRRLFRQLVQAANRRAAVRGAILTAEGDDRPVELANLDWLFADLDEPQLVVV